MFAWMERKFNACQGGDDLNQFIKITDLNHNKNQIQSYSNFV